MPLDKTNAAREAESLSKLLTWNDLDFVRCAYVTVLGRVPDPEGEAYYLHRLRCGHSKLEILRQLRRSREGRIREIEIVGFDRALRRSAWARKPIVGLFIRLFTGEEGDDRVTRLRYSLLNAISTIKSSNEEGSPKLNDGAANLPELDFKSGGYEQKSALSPAAQEAFEILIGRKSR